MYIQVQGIQKCTQKSKVSKRFLRVKCLFSEKVLKRGILMPTTGLKGCVCVGAASPAQVLQAGGGYCGASPDHCSLWLRLVTGSIQSVSHPYLLVFKWYIRTNITIKTLATICNDPWPFSGTTLHLTVALFRPLTSITLSIKLVASIASYPW